MLLCGVVSIHSPRKGRDEAAATKAVESSEFQSTLPVKGETIITTWIFTKLNVSIHSPRKGRDAVSLITSSRKLLFQSTLPVKGETAFMVSILT